METKVNGMTFVNKDPLFKELQPTGLLDLVPDPNNKYDKMAVEVFTQHPDGKSDPVRIGFLPATVKGCPEIEAQNKKLQAWVHEHPNEAIGVVLKYSYFDDDIKFNEEHIGRLQSCVVYVTDSIEDARQHYKQYHEIQKRVAGPDKAPDEAIDVTSTHYIKAKKKYRRVTDLLGCYEPDGKEGFDRIIKWAMQEGLKALPDEVWLRDKPLGPMELADEIYKAYRGVFEATGDDGTDKHDAIEQFCRVMMDGVADDSVEDLFNATPVGFQNFWNKYKPEVLGVETTVFNDELGIAGTYDAKFAITLDGVKRIVVADWKRSKAVRKKHKTQAGFYTVMEDADEGWVIALGAATKQGYSLNTQNREECDAQFDKIGLINKLQNME